MPSATGRQRGSPRWSGGSSITPGQDVSDHLCLLMYCRELLGKVLNSVVEKTGLGDGTVKKVDFVSFLHLRQVQPTCPKLRNQSSSCELSGQGGRFHSSPAFTAAWERMAVNSGSDSTCATLTEGLRSDFRCPEGKVHRCTQFLQITLAQNYPCAALDGRHG